MEFNVPSMSCGHCVDAIARAVEAADGDARIAIDLDAKSVRIESGLPRPHLAAVLAEAGYPVA